MVAFGNILNNAKSGDKIYLQDMKPQDVDKILRENGYECGDPQFMGRGLVIRHYIKKNCKDVKMYASALNFELFIVFSEPCNYFI